LRQELSQGNVATYEDVLGEPCDGELTEASPFPATREVYGDVKQQIERMLLDFRQRYGLAATILQPTIVYGPHGYFFTIRPLEELRSGSVGLPVGGLCMQCTLTMLYQPRYLPRKAMLRLANSLSYLVTLP
jgi:hypothetical protein